MLDNFRGLQKKRLELLNEKLEILDNSSDDELLRREIARLAYYILFQELTCFSMEVLFSTIELSDDEWVKIFRSLEHNEVKNKLKTAYELEKKQRKDKYFKNIDILYATFVDFQDFRLQADYDPRPFAIDKSSLIAFTSLLKTVIKLLYIAPNNQKIALATHLLFKDRSLNKSDKG